MHPFLNTDDVTLALRGPLILGRYLALFAKFLSKNRKLTLKRL